MSQVKAYDLEHARLRFRTFVVWKEKRNQMKSESIGCRVSGMRVFQVKAFDLEHVTLRFRTFQKGLGAGSREGVSQVKAYNFGARNPSILFLGPHITVLSQVLWKEKRNQMKSERTGRKVSGGRVPGQGL